MDETQREAPQLSVRLPMPGWAPPRPHRHLLPEHRQLLPPSTGRPPGSACCGPATATSHPFADWIAPMTLGGRVFLDTRRTSFCSRGDTCPTGNASAQPRGKGGLPPFREHPGRCPHPCPHPPSRPAKEQSLPLPGRVARREGKAEKPEADERRNENTTPAEWRD